MRLLKKPTFILIFCSILIVSSFSACSRKRDVDEQKFDEPITLSFFGIFDNEDVFTPIIETYESQNPNVNVIYRKFTNPDRYLDLIVNEIAEGEGPDIFMLHNTWFPKHYKKLSPAPSTVITAETFTENFVEVTSVDLIIPDKNGVNQVWGLPIYVDNLALYYNQQHFREVLPEKAQPSQSWQGLQEDVIALNKQDNSFERFARAGIAMGRGDNILRAFDILMMLFLQFEVTIYDEDLSEIVFENDPNAVTALDLYSIFALPSQKTYSWNRYLSDRESGEKELTSFARGKVSMIFGYSFTYDDIIEEISRLKSLNIETIDINDIQIQKAPQLFDSETSEQKPITYASYFSPVVSRTSKNQEAAWDFLAFLVQEENLSFYFEKTHKPSSKWSLSNEQKDDPIYGVFAAQNIYAASIPMADAKAYESIFIEGMEDILATQSSETVLNEIAIAIQDLIPSSGVKPVYVPTE